jgi:putative oxidoreductase
MDDADLALLLLRVVIGVTLALHGIQKIRGGLGRVARWFDGMGMRPGWLHARFAAFGEIAAGLFFAAGLLTSFAALGFVGLMTVAGWTDHRDKGFFIIKQGWEYVMVLAVVATSVAIIGPGRWSIDHTIGIDDELDGIVGLLIAAGGGLAAAIALMAVFYRPSNDQTVTT